MFKEIFLEEKLKCPKCGGKAKTREDGQNAKCIKCGNKDELSKFKSLKETDSADIANVETPLFDKRRKHNKKCKCSTCCDKREKLTQTQAILRRG